MPLTAPRWEYFASYRYHCTTACLLSFQRNDVDSAKPRSQRGLTVLSISSSRHTDDPVSKPGPLTSYYAGVNLPVGYSIMSTNPWDLFPDADESARRLAEWLLVESVDDLRMRSREGASRYERLGISAVLRRTLTDKRPVLPLARARLKLAPPMFSFTPWTGPDPEPTQGGLIKVFDWAHGFSIPTEMTDLDGLLKADVGHFFRKRVTVLDLIRYFAHVYGGVHLGKPTNDFEAVTQRFAASHELLAAGWEHALADIARVVIDGLTPLTDAIRADPFPLIDALRGLTEALENRPSPGHGA